MTNSNVGFNKEEIKEINRFGFERDLWWRAKVNLLDNIESLKLNCDKDIDNDYKDLIIIYIEEILAFINQGLWQPSTELLGDLFDSPQIQNKFLEWEEADIANGWLPIYYNQHIQSQVADNLESFEPKTTLDQVYKNLVIQAQFDDATLTSDDSMGWFPTDMDSYKDRWIDPLTTPELDNKLINQINEAMEVQLEQGPGFRIRQWLYQLLAEKTVWEDDIKGYPVTEAYFENNNRVGQICDLRPLQYEEANFIKELFSMYCPTWEFNQRQSKKRILIYDRPYVDEDYQWHLIIRKSSGQFSGFDSFHVILAKKLPVKLSPFNVIFQAQFPNQALHQFQGDRYMSNWKVDVKYRYMYVERYINYIEPLIAERMQGIE